MEVEYKVQSLEGGSETSRVIVAKVRVSFFPEDGSPIAPIHMDLEVLFRAAERDKSLAELHATAVVTARAMLNEDFVIGWLADQEDAARGG